HDLGGELLDLVELGVGAEPRLEPAPQPLEVARRRLLRRAQRARDRLVHGGQGLELRAAGRAPVEVTGDGVPKVAFRGAIQERRELSSYVVALHPRSPRECSAGGDATACAPDLPSSP